jgi:symplekin
MTGFALHRLLTDLPEIPISVLGQLQSLCTDSADRTKGKAGMKILKEIAVERPPLREEALRILLELCTHSGELINSLPRVSVRSSRPSLVTEANLLGCVDSSPSDANTRNPAIATVRQWIPEPKAMSETIKTFALRLLHRLAKLGKAPKEETVVGKEGKQGDEKKLDSVLSPESEAEAKEAKMDEDPVDAVAEEDREADAELVESRYLPEKLELPVEQETVRQHVELAFALTKKVPELLDAYVLPPLSPFCDFCSCSGSYVSFARVLCPSSIFTTYPILSPPIQAHFRPILSPLIKSLGPNNGKLLTLLRTFPPGADSLVLHVLHVLGEPKEEGGPRVKMSVPLVALVKGLVAERDLDPRFIVPIVPEMDKVRLFLLIISDDKNPAHHRSDELTRFLPYPFRPFLNPNFQLLRLPSLLT